LFIELTNKNHTNQNMPSYITSIGTAVPDNCIDQQKIADFMCEALALDETNTRKLKALYRHTKIAKRHSVISDYANKNGQYSFFPNTNDLEPFPTILPRMSEYRKHALPLAKKAIENCFQNVSNTKYENITHLITVSCTGMYAPGLDIDIVQTMGLNTNVKRTCINFMGCYGAFNALKLADSICIANQNAKVLIVSVELCTLHFQKKISDNNLLSNALFADGAAAVLVEGIISRYTPQGVYLPATDTPQGVYLPSTDTPLGVNMPATDTSQGVYMPATDTSQGVYMPATDTLLGVSQPAKYTPEGVYLHGVNLQLKSFYCDLFPEGKNDMAWDIADFGFEMTLTQNVPKIIKEGIGSLFHKLLNESNLTKEQITLYALHPGGKAILEAIESALNLSKIDNKFAYEILANFGNMSSATVLFVLKNLMSQITEADKNKNILSCAFGPGLTLESMILEVV
jgi:predicted naringenin-chalcone synthase